MVDIYSWSNVYGCQYWYEQHNKCMKNAIDQSTTSLPVLWASSTKKIHEKGISYRIFSAALNSVPASMRVSLRRYRVLRFITSLILSRRSFVAFLSCFNLANISLWAFNILGMNPDIVPFFCWSANRSTQYSGVTAFNTNSTSSHHTLLVKQSYVNS